MYKRHNSQSQYDGGRGQVKSLLRHYFNLCFEKATGHELDKDCDTEIEDMVDYIFDGVKREIFEDLQR